MPQPSIGYAMARVRVREGGLLTPARLERILAAPDLEELLRVAAETGIGEGQEMADADALEAACEASVAAAAALLSEISPQPEVTDLFLLRYDAQNIKALIKARGIGLEEPRLIRGGTVAPEELAPMIDERRYGTLPEGFAAALRALDQEMMMEFRPQRVDLAIDRALAKEMALRAGRASSGAVIRWVRDGLDLQNAIILLRLKTTGEGRDLFSEALLPGGAIGAEDWLKAWEAPERMPALFAEGALRALAGAGYATWHEGAGLSAFERDREDYLMRLFSQKRRENFAIEPIIGYLLARERESAVLRLAALAKVRRLPAETVRERLRELYG